MSALAIDVRELNYDEIDEVSGGLKSIREMSEAFLVGAGAGGLIGGIAGNAPGAAIGAAVGGVGAVIILHL